MINKIPMPTPGAPNNTDDYDRTNNLIQILMRNYYSVNSSPFTEWDDVSLNIPEIRQGAVIFHGGLFYIAETSNYSITPTAPASYIQVYFCAEPINAGENLSVYLIDNVAGFTWNEIYGGWYDIAGRQILPFGMRYNSPSAGVNNYDDKYGLVNSRSWGLKNYLKDEFSFDGKIIANNNIISNGDLHVAGNKYTTIGGHKGIDRFSNDEFLNVAGMDSDDVYAWLVSHVSEYNVKWKMGGWIKFGPVEKIIMNLVAVERKSSGSSEQYFFYGGRSDGNSFPYVLTLGDPSDLSSGELFVY